MAGGVVGVVAAAGTDISGGGAHGSPIGSPGGGMGMGMGVGGGTNSPTRTASSGGGEPSRGVPSGPSTAQLAARMALVKQHMRAVNAEVHARPHGSLA